MRVSVLGPLEVEECDRVITPSAGKPRQLVALLALHAGEVVPLRTIVEELWGARPPGNPAQSVQTYVLNLRRAVHAVGGPWARARLTTHHTGYQLDLGPDDLDVRHYERLAGAGRWALDQDDPERASVLLSAALEVWRGPALVDVPVGGPLAGKVSGLDVSRLGVLEARIDADLRLGRHSRILGELSELNAQYPMHESVCAQYMTALYRSGRKWQALEVFRALRAVLVDELGLEPSRRAREVHQAILNSDPALDAFDQRAATA